MQYEKKGFGYVYQNVTRSKQLTAESKAIYAYLASFSGNSEMCYPSIQLMLNELGMSKTRFYKHMGLLIEKGIVTKQQEKQENRFCKNTYIISSFPSFEDTQIEDTRNRDTQIKDTQNLTTNSNSIKTNSINSNSKKSTPHPLKHKYGEFKKVLLTDDEKERLISEFGQDTFDKCIVKLDEYIEMKGYKAHNHNLCIRKWVVKAVKEDEGKESQKGEGKTYGEKYDTGNCYSTEYYKQFDTN